MGFALSLGLDYSAPSEPLIVVFIEHLARTQRTAAAVLSTISTLKGVLTRSNISVTSFSATSVSLMLRSIKINKRTPAIQRPPMRPDTVRLVLIRFEDMDYSCELRVAIILMFVTSFRQSNIAPPTTRQFDPSRHLTRADIRVGHDRIEICQHWSKTQQQVTIGRWIPVPRIRHSKMCPHAAISALLRASPTRSLKQPFLCFHDGNPMPAPYIARQFRLALTRAGLGHKGYTLHSLRREVEKSRVCSCLKSHTTVAGNHQRYTDMSTAPMSNKHSTPYRLWTEPAHWGFGHHTLDTWTEHQQANKEYQ